MKIIVVGGGIGGLSAAIALRFAGHQVTILEKSTLHNEIGAAIHIQPNATRILLPYDFSPERAQLVLARKALYGNGETLEISFEETWDEKNWEKEYGAKFWLAHRVDLHAELKLLATRVEGVGVPVVIETGCEVVSYDVENGTVTLANGKERKGDLIVAADGIHSRAVKYVVGYDNPAKKTGIATFRFLIPSEDILSDDETKDLMRDHDGVFRYFKDSEKKVIVWYPCRGNQVQNFALIIPEHEGLNAQEGWNNDASREVFFNEARNFHPSLQALLRKVKDVKLWEMLSRDPLPTWHKSRLVVIGDAAHPMLPMQGQAGAQAISDGAALGILFTNFNATDAESISARLKMFENARMNKASVIQKLSDTEFLGPDAMREATQPYMPGEIVPLTRPEHLRYRFSQDVVKDCKKELDKVEQERQSRSSRRYCASVVQIFTKLYQK